MWAHLCEVALSSVSEASLPIVNHTTVVTSS
jgi:hypothetical protein